MSEHKRDKITLDEFIKSERPSDDFTKRIAEFKRWLETPEGKEVLSRAKENREHADAKMSAKWKECCVKPCDLHTPMDI